MSTGCPILSHRSCRMTRGAAGRGGRRKLHATTIFLAVGGSDVLSMIREQKHLLHHRSHCRYRHRPQIARPVLTQGLSRLATSNFIRYSLGTWQVTKLLRQPKDHFAVAAVFTRLKRRCLMLALSIRRTEWKSEVKRTALSELRLDPYSSRMFFDHHFCNVESKSYAATILAMYL